MLLEKADIEIENVNDYQGLIGRKRRRAELADEDDDDVFRADIKRLKV